MDEQEIINGVSAMIARAKRALYSEYCAPSLSPDDSDDKIKQLRAKIGRLRSVRTELENVFFGEGEN